MQFFANLTFIGTSLVAAIGCAHNHEIEEDQVPPNNVNGHIDEDSAIIRPEGKLVFNDTMRVEKQKSEVERK